VRALLGVLNVLIVIVTKLEDASIRTCSSVPWCPAVDVDYCKIILPIAIMQLSVVQFIYTRQII